MKAAWPLLFIVAFAALELSKNWVKAPWPLLFVRPDRRAFCPVLSPGHC